MILSEKYVKLDDRILKDTRLSLEAIATYLRLEYECIDIEDVAPHIVDELIQIGYFEVVA